MSQTNKKKVHRTEFGGNHKQLTFFITKRAGIRGHWIGNYIDLHVFHSLNGGHLIWWPSTKDLVLVGNWQQAEVARLRGAIKFYDHTPRTPQPAQQSRPSVHIEPIPFDDVNPDYLP